MKMKQILSVCLALMLTLGCAIALAENELPNIANLPAVTLGENTYEPLPWDATKALCPPHVECYAENNLGYHDDSIDVRIETFRAYDTTIMATYITLTDVSQFRTSFAGRNIHSQSTKPVHNLAKEVKAVVAINDDYCTHHTVPEGIVVRNGAVLRQKPKPYRDSLFIDKNGDFTLIRGCTQEQFDAIKDNVLHSFCFGPALVVDGQPITQEDITRIRGLNCGPTNQTQRITISQIGPLQYLVLATEGPENKGSRGLTIMEMTQLCMDIGLDNAYNLDGGSSSTVVMNYKKVNSLSSGKVRPVGGCIWFASLVP